MPFRSSSSGNDRELLHVPNKFSFCSGLVPFILTKERISPLLTCESGKVLKQSSASSNSNLLFGANNLTSRFLDGFQYIYLQRRRYPFAIEHRSSIKYFSADWMSSGVNDGEGDSISIDGSSVVSVSFSVI